MEFDVQIDEQGFVTVNGMPVPESCDSSCTEVYYFDEYVLKIDANEISTKAVYYTQCVRTVDNWERVKNTTHADFFAPVLAHGECRNRKWLIQPLVRGTYGSISATNPKAGFTDGVRDGVMAAISFLNLVDIHGGNYKMCDGFPIIFDYAC